MSRFRQMVKSAMMTTLPMRLLLARGPTRSIVGAGRQTLCLQQVALTFDDGPHPGQTPRVLDYLAASTTRATFFVIGECAQQHPGLIRRIASEGHELGNHTFTHSDPVRTSTKAFLQEIRQTRTLLQDLTGQSCSLTRPPHGQLTPGKLWGLWEEQQTVVLWNIETRDQHMRSRKQMERWCADYSPSNGDVVLMHDNRPFASTAIQNLTERRELESIQFVCVSDWLDGQARHNNSELIHR